VLERFRHSTAVRRPWWQGSLVRRACADMRERLYSGPQTPQVEARELRVWIYGNWKPYHHSKNCGALVPKARLSSAGSWLPTEDNSGTFPR